MRNAMKIGLALAALVAAGVYSVSAEDVSQQAVLNGTVVSVIEAGTPVKEGDVLVSVDSLVGGVPAARADRDGVVKEVRAGITWVNAFNPTFNEAPWGGYKMSGIGRELGVHGLEEYQEIKQVNINLTPGAPGWYEH